MVFTKKKKKNLRVILRLYTTKNEKKNVVILFRTHTHIITKEEINTLPLRDLCQLYLVFFPICQNVTDLIDGYGSNSAWSNLVKFDECLLMRILKYFIICGLDWQLNVKVDIHYVICRYADSMPSEEVLWTWKMSMTRNIKGEYILFLLGINEKKMSLDEREYFI